MNKLFWLVLLGVVILLSGCKKNLSGLPDDSPPSVRPLTKTETGLIDSNYKFGLNLFRTISANEAPDTNIFISPLSVSLALGMALNGAEGQTYEDMKTTLELQGLSEAAINSAYKSLMELLESIDDQVLFEIANSIWSKKGFAVEADFIETNQYYFNAETSVLDFARSDAVQIINGWIAEKTHNRIEKVLDVIPSNAVMYLINAIYFKAIWKYQFDEEYTKNEPFYCTDQNVHQRPFMKTTADLNYYEDESVQVVDIPYGHGNYSMTIILPGADRNLNSYISEFSNTTWQSYLEQFELKKGTVSLPKFKVEYRRLLNDDLAQMGMAIAFGGGANFQRISPDRELYISRVIHQTFVQADEEGTEAAAVTVVEFKETSGGVSDLEFTLTVNRPFIYIIREHNTNAILFMGRMVLPEWTE